MKKLFTWALLALAILLIEFPYFKIPFSENEGMFTCVAQEMRHGAKLYKDVWDHKPPFLFLHFIWLENFFGNGELSFRMYTVFIHFLDAILIFFLTQKLNFGRRKAWFSAWAYVFLLFPPYFQAWTPQAEVLMQPFLIAAFYFWLLEGNWTGILAGMVWGISFFTKPVALFFAPLLLFLNPNEKLNKAIWFILVDKVFALARAETKRDVGRDLFKSELGLIEQRVNEFLRKNSFEGQK